VWVAGKVTGYSSSQHASLLMVNLCDPALTRATSERFRDEQLIIKRDTNKASYAV